jgi:cytochrome c553
LKAAAFLAAAGLCAAATAQPLPAQSPAQLPAPLQAKAAACAACHGADGHATLAEAPHLAGQPRLFIENRLVMMREGLSVVPQMAGQLDGLSDADLAALARHYATMPLKPERPARDASRAARGAALSQRALCGSCHLPDYGGREQIPRLAGQREDYLLKSMRDFAAGRTGGRDTLMSNALIGLSDTDLQDLAHHLATLPAAR